MSTLRRYASLWGPVLVLGLTNFYLSSLSKSTLWFMSVNGNGKVLHVVGSIVIGLFALRACHGGFGDLSRRPTSLAIFGCFLWAVSDEFHQTLVPGRGSTPAGDVILDTLGVLASLVLWLAFQYGLDIFRYLSHPKWPDRSRSTDSND